jgi:hypothetical protein
MSTPDARELFAANIEAEYPGAAQVIRDLLAENAALRSSQEKSDLLQQAEKLPLMLHHILSSMRRRGYVRVYQAVTHQEFSYEDVENLLSSLTAQPQEQP